MAGIAADENRAGLYVRLFDFLHTSAAILSTPRSRVGAIAPTSVPIEIMMGSASRKMLHQ